MVEYHHVATPTGIGPDDCWLRMRERDTEWIRLILLEPSDLS